LQSCDAENLCQEVLIRVWKGIAGYDPAKGRFRGWLYTCTRNTVSNLRRSQPRERSVDHNHQVVRSLSDREMPGPGFWRQRSDECSAEAALRVLEEEGFAWDRLQEAVRKVRAGVQPATWKAFLLFELFDRPAKEIAPRLGMTPSAVNQAVYRVCQLFRQALGSEGKGSRTPPEAAS
jgi:RNA polymerase sigma-70 factor (ECF subfamily)